MTLTALDSVEENRLQANDESEVSLSNESLCQRVAHTLDAFGNPLTGEEENTLRATNAAATWPKPTATSDSCAPLIAPEVFSTEPTPKGWLRAHRLDLAIGLTMLALLMGQAMMYQRWKAQTAQAKAQETYLSTEITNWIRLGTIPSNGQAASGITQHEMDGGTTVWHVVPATAEVCPTLAKKLAQTLPSPHLVKINGKGLTPFVYQNQKGSRTWTNYTPTLQDLPTLCTFNDEPFDLQIQRPTVASSSNSK